MVQQPDNRQKLTLCEVETREVAHIINISAHYLPPDVSLDLADFADNDASTCSSIDGSALTTDAVVRIKLATPFKLAEVTVVSHGINYEFARSVPLSQT